MISKYARLCLDEIHTNGVMRYNACGVDEIHSFRGEGVIFLCIFGKNAQKTGGGDLLIVQY